MPHFADDDTMDPMALEVAMFPPGPCEATEEDMGAGIEAIQASPSPLATTERAEEAASTEEESQEKTHEEEPAVQGERQEPASQATRSFVHKFTKDNVQPLLKTPIKNKGRATAGKEDKMEVRRSGRIAEKMRKVGNKTVEEMAEESVAKKLGVLSPTKNLTNETRERLIKLFTTLVTAEMIEAIEALLKIMNLDSKEPKKGKKKVVPVQP